MNVNNVITTLENNHKVTKSPLLKMAIICIKELQKQVKKMRCCENCKHPYCNAETEKEETVCDNCVNESNLEMKE